jgi:hypothetical protein
VNLPQYFWMFVGATYHWLSILVTGAILVWYALSRETEMRLRLAV